MADHLNPLVPHQKVFIIDAHGHEKNSEERDRMYDDTTFDLHFHKKTNPITINNKMVYEANVRIPINNPDAEVSVDWKDYDSNEIPGRIKKEIKKALKDRQTREAFVKRLSEILATYPSQKNNKTKTEDALRRFAEAFGIGNIQVKEEWFTHITKDPKRVSMLSVKSIDDRRYNFLSCDDYMLAEEAEPTAKFIIRLYGGEKSGKTESISIALRILLERFPEHAIIIDNGEKSGDVKALLFINGAKVGIESQGDPNSRQMRSIDEFASMGCDVILTASRTWGMTKRSVEAQRENHYLIYTFKKAKEVDEKKHYVDNEAMGLRLAEFVEGATKGAFYEL